MPKIDLAAISENPVSDYLSGTRILSSFHIRQVLKCYNPDKLRIPSQPLKQSFRKCAGERFLPQIPKPTHKSA
jgi:hypothetical protein